MKTPYIFFIIILAISCKKEPIIPKQDYLMLRQKALTKTPEELGLNLPADTLVTYGVVMDFGGWGYTTVAYSNGYAALLDSIKNKVITNKQNIKINKIAKQFVESASTLINKNSASAIKTPIPDRDYVSFYILTNKGIFARYGNSSTFVNNFSPTDEEKKLIQILDKGNEIYLRIRYSIEKPPPEIVDYLNLH